MSHLGRPGGRRKPELSFRHVAPIVEELLGTKVHFLEDTVGPEVEERVQNAQNGEIFLLENLR